MGFENIQIFLAEDDDDDSELFNVGIYGAGIKADINRVRDGRELLSYLNNFLPDIIFLDINMPGMDGKKCLKAIREQDAFNNIPVIILTTSAFDKDIKETFRYGANRFVTKQLQIKDQIMAFKKIFTGDWRSGLLINNYSTFVLD